MLRSAALAVLVALLVAAPAATASTVHQEGGRIVLAARAGERNRVVVTPAPLGATLIADAAGVTPTGAGCVAVSPTSVQCLGQGRLDAFLGDRDDSFDASAYARPVDVAGGPGRDGITGGPGDDVTAGGPGRDVEDGGPGDDQLDALAVDGDPATTAAGADTLRGGPGRDTIHAVSPGDRVSAGPGDDDVMAVAPDGEDDHSRQVVDCGPGTDTVAVGSRDDVSACERPFFARFCFPGPRCQVRWVATAGRRVVARGVTRKALGLRLTCRIALNAAGRRLAHRPGGATIGVSTQLRSGRTLFAPEATIRGLRLRLHSPG